MNQQEDKAVQQLPSEVMNEETVAAAIGNKFTTTMTNKTPLTFLQSIQLPNVLSYAFALFFAKLVAYAFIFWLPSILSNYYHNDAKVVRISSVYDIGSIFGGIVAGYLADKFIEKKAIICLSMQLIGAFFLYLYSLLPTNIFILFVIGLFINGPYTLISGAIAADLADQGSHQKQLNKAATSTVTGFIDAIGTLGAVLQSLAIGILSDQFSYQIVFFF